MDNRPSSDDLLGHFDRPKRLELPEFEWVDEVVPFGPAPDASNGAPTPAPVTERFIEVPRFTRRGVGWVLAWGGALTVLAIGAGVLIEFAYVLGAERMLLVAARAGALEATLPRATPESIKAAIERRLTANPRLTGELHIRLAQNGSLVQQRFHPADGDRFDVSAWVPVSAVIPDWLRRLIFWRSETRIQVHVERQVPGRKLPLLKT